jgi:hypothetical protein
MILKNNTSLLISIGLEMGLACKEGRKMIIVIRLWDQVEDQRISLKYQISLNLVTVTDVVSIGYELMNSTIKNERYTLIAQNIMFRDCKYWQMHFKLRATWACNLSWLKYGEWYNAAC